MLRVEIKNTRAIFEIVGKGEETRRVICEAAMRSISLEGFDALTIGTLAKQVGMSKSGLFAHFRAKDELLAEVLRYASARFIDVVVAPALMRPRGEARVRALIELWLDWRERADIPGGCIFLIASHEFDDRPGPLRDQILQLQSDWIETLTTAVCIAQRERHFSSQLDPDQLVFEIYALMMGFHFYQRLLVDPNAKRRVQNAVDGLLERWKSETVDDLLSSPSQLMRRTALSRRKN